MTRSYCYKALKPQEVQNEANINKTYMRAHTHTHNNYDTLIGKIKINKPKLNYAKTTKTEMTDSFKSMNMIKESYCYKYSVR